MHFSAFEELHLYMMKHSFFQAIFLIILDFFNLRFHGIPNSITLDKDMILASGFHQFEAQDVVQKLVTQYLTQYEKIATCD